MMEKEGTATTAVGEVGHVSSDLNMSTEPASLNDRAGKAITLMVACPPADRTLNRLE
jgi:hypothetical protein